MNSPRVLVIDDDPDIRALVAELLDRAGFIVEQAENGRAGLRALHKAPPDLVVLDVSMPDMDGWQTLERIRDLSKVPVMMVTARGDELERVRGLQGGADDYVVKPFGARELLARIRAVLRRTSPDTAHVISFADVQVDLDRRVVTRGGEEIKMTRAEYNLLTFFLQNPDRALTRDVILNSVWGYESFPNTRTVDAHIVRLRQKLEPDAETPRHFVTMHGVGYRFIP